MENRKVYLDDHTNLLQLEEHITKHVNSQKPMGSKIWSVVEAMAV